MGSFPRFLWLAAVMMLVVFLFAVPPLWSQGETEKSREDDPVSCIGLSLSDLLNRFGVPRSVYASRGLETWQDDVVFVYDEGEFYIFKDRVWQAGLKAVMGVSTGDSRGVALLVLGSKAQPRGDSIFYPLNEKAWPMMIRYDLDRAGRVQAIFIYRTDI